MPTPPKPDLVLPAPSHRECPILARLSQGWEATPRAANWGITRNSTLERNPPHRPSEPASAVRNPLSGFVSTARTGESPETREWNTTHPHCHSEPASAGEESDVRLCVHRPNCACPILALLSQGWEATPPAAKWRGTPTSSAAEDNPTSLSFRTGFSREESAVRFCFHRPNRGITRNSTLEHNPPHRHSKPSSSGNIDPDVPHPHQRPRPGV